jgi:DNA-binding MarR family transcriptional regulator
MYLFYKEKIWIQNTNSIEKESHARDAHVSPIKLTAAGEELFNDALQSVQEISQNIFEPFDENAVKTFASLIKSVQ